MILQWYGQSFFKIQTHGLNPDGTPAAVVIAIDPFSKEPAWGITKVPHFRADIVLITHDHPDHNNASAIEGEPMIISGPGEYESKGIFIQGIPSFHDKRRGAEHGRNTIFVIEAEDLRLAHFGDFGEGKVGEELLEALGHIDILCVPVGGNYTIHAGEAMHAVHQIEPGMVIPMHYKVKGLTLEIDGLDKFLKEFGIKNIVPEEKVVVRKKDLGEGGIKLRVLQPLAFA